MLHLFRHTPLNVEAILRYPRPLRPARSAGSIDRPLRLMTRSTHMPSCPCPLLPVLSVVLLSVMAAAAGPTTRLTSSLDETTLARGRQMRQLLLKGLAEVAQPGGAWPGQLRASQDANSKLIYTPPGETAFPQFIRPATVVVHESREEYPEGVWVGYADGHVEFARSPEAFTSCKGQLAILQPTLDKYGNPFGPAPKEHVDLKHAAARLKGNLKLRIVGPDGKPIPGALVGIHSYWGDESDPDLRVFFYDEPKERPMVTDADGKVVVTAKRAIARLDLNPEMAP